ncbi:MAG TPA: carboxypeptidase-like regulatory domain-containing protein [Terracidiphilus sp.]|nr:carboxypeptidase-like regulatory domain-containing protein [Terracidiphilus sp.]
MNVFRTIVLILLTGGALAQAASISGTVTNKTNGKPAAGDAVELLDVQAGMAAVAHATTNASGHYSLDEPGPGPYLVRVTHQGAGYFIAAPQGGGSGDIPVYDVAPKVKGVYIEADVLEVETQNGQLSVNERYLVHNLSNPAVTQWSPKGFEIVLPPDAEVNGAGAQRPGGLPTSVNVVPTGVKGHFTFNFPIQPDNGDKDTMLQISYNVPYAAGKYTFQSLATMQTDDLAVLLPKSMTFTGASGAGFQPINEDPSVQTFLLKNAPVGKTVAFTVSGTGSIPRDTQSGQQQSAANSAADGNGGQPGGGIGQPIDTPDPLSKYKWWILGGLGLLLAAAAAFLLRRPPGTPALAVAGGGFAGSEAAPMTYAAGTSSAAGAYASPAASAANPAVRNAALLNALKEELFALESEKIAGTLAPHEYDVTKAALETVLRRALKRNSY